MKQNNMKKIAGIALAGVLGVTTLCAGMTADAKMEHKPQKEAKNIILLVGDGMGPTQISAAAYLKGEGYASGSLALNRFRDVGYATTFSHDNRVTDSSAAATAFATGHKTDNGVVGQAPTNEVHVSGEEMVDVESVLELAEKKGKATGMVTTTRLTHATPASFASHVESRGLENEIATQLLQRDIDVLLGGGKRHFTTEAEGGRRDDGVNLLQEAKEKGYTLVEDRQSLQKSKSKKLLGLFNSSHMNYELDRSETKEPSLAEMTKKSLKVLNKDKDGFFLMVEGGRIDHAGHANMSAANMTDMLAFDDAVKEAYRFARKDKNTLVIVTADHETGGMSLGANGTYAFNKEVIEKQKRTTEFMGAQLNEDRSNAADVVAKYAGITDLTEAELETIRTAEYDYLGIAQVISERANVGWTTTGHTGVNVPVYSYGPRSRYLTGTVDNTMIAHVIEEALHKK
ncbi:alkaline phosphatase [Mechercharimyces sp. CAU 1602]|uniref:alkaline phosphatase n=1 Tax=Mechercharimyces sp. CAU 1602 TaxID=2973933 RepID=UPI0021621E84|nr:alkaline phosphatase [Mechercharimyces sp. CAU 1602]MCS1350667.1 alkaline phosphatase [Mechercharimyces sp. CAU 1602]